MTTLLREHGPASGFIQGNVLIAQTCIGVVWPWLTLPVIPPVMLQESSNKRGSKMIAVAFKINKYNFILNGHEAKNGISDRKSL